MENVKHRFLRLKGAYDSSVELLNPTISSSAKDFYNTAMTLYDTAVQCGYEARNVKLRGEELGYSLTEMFIQTAEMAMQRAVDELKKGLGFSKIREFNSLHGIL